MEKVKIDAAFLKNMKAGKFDVKVIPAIRREHKSVNFEDKEAMIAFLKTKPEDVAVIQRGPNYLMITDRQFKAMSAHAPRRREPVKKNREAEKPSSIWDREDEVLALFPQVSDLFASLKARISSAGCTSCARRGAFNKLTAELAKEHVKHPEITIPEDLIKILGPTFGRAVTRIKYSSEPYGTIAVETGTAANRLLRPVLHTHYTEGVRPSCLDCCRKHLGQAITLFQESEFEGYENHFWLGIGHLAEVESESLSTYPYFAKQLRDIRLAMMVKRDYVPNLMSLFDDMDILEDEEGADDKNKDDEKAPVKKADTSTASTKKAEAPVKKADTSTASMKKAKPTTTVKKTAVSGKKTD